LPTKKRKKNKKGKNKAVEPEVEEAEEENLTVADKAKKVKKAMEEYKALDHEDMVSRLSLVHRRRFLLTHRSETCPHDSNTPAPNPLHSA
jgi:hypothetical protein